MKDLEICKRIAEIEGVKIDVLVGKAILDEMLGGIRVSLTEYNPLTDDALCFQLMVKYMVEIDYDDKEASIYKNSDFRFIATATHKYVDNINRAICLAIIEAHKEK